MIKKSFIFGGIVLLIIAIFSIYKLSISVEKIENYFVTKEYQSKFNVNSSSRDATEKGFEKLKKENEDIVGWISIPDTDINYPIVQTDNNEFYQTHNLNRKENNNGAIFLDYRNNLGGQDQNFTIYGKDLFSDLTAYKYQDYYNDHRKIIFSTDKGYMEAYVFAVFEAHKNNAVPYIWWDDKRERSRYLDFSRERSYILSDTKIKDAENILTLSTETDWSEDVHFIVQAVIINAQQALPSEHILEEKMKID